MARRRADPGSPPESTYRHAARAASRASLGLAVVALLTEVVLIVIGTGSPELLAGLATTASFAAGAATLVRGLSYSCGLFIYFYLAKGAADVPERRSTCSHARAEAVTRPA